MLFPRMPYGVAPPQQGAALHRGPMPFLKSEMSPKSPSGGEAMKLASPHLLSPAGVSTSMSGGSGDAHGVHGDSRVLHGIPLLSDPGFALHQWPAMMPPHMCKPPFPPAPHMAAGTRSMLPLPVPQSLMIPPTRGMLPRWPAPNAYMGTPFPGTSLPGMGPGAFMPDVGHSHMNPAGLSSPGGRGKTATPTSSQVQFLPTACNVQSAASHPLNKLTSDPMQHHGALHSMAKVAQMNSVTGSMSPTFRNHDDLQAARMQGHMTAEGHRSPLFWHSVQPNGMDSQSPGGTSMRHMAAHELNGGMLNSKLHMLNDPLRVETSPAAYIPHHLVNDNNHRSMYGQPHQRAAAAAAATNVQWSTRDNNLLCVQRPTPMHPGGWQVPRPGQRLAEEMNIEDDGLNDLIQPSIVDHMVRFIERSLDDTPAPENELANIHIGHGNVAMPGETTPPGDKVPLYLRGSGKGSQQSYASAVRSRPLPMAPNQLPELDTDDGDLNLTGEQGQPNPLDLLKNLNIKASPGTQAFYQYFS